MRHRRAATHNEQVLEATWNDHSVRKLIVPAHIRNVRKAPYDVAVHVRFHRPAIPGDAVVEIGATKDVLFRQDVVAHDASGFADAELRRDVHDCLTNDIWSPGR